MANSPLLNLTSTLPLLHSSIRNKGAKSVYIPVLGLGVYRIKPSTSTSESHCHAACQAALAAGYRHIDTARLYRNEPDVINAVCSFSERFSGVEPEDGEHSAESEAVSGRGRLTREDIFLTTKIRESTGDPNRDYRAALKCVERLAAPASPARNQGGARTTAAKEPPGTREIKRRKIDDSTSPSSDTSPYVDLFLIHQAMPTLQERKSLWQALERLHHEGRARNIGVSNYRIKDLEEMREYANIWPPSVNQIEVHPWFPQKDLTAYCSSHGIVVEAFAPLAQGKHFATPPSKGGKEDNVLESIASKHDKSMAQVLVRWSLQKGFVVLPKSSKPERIRENADVFDFQLDLEDMETLDSLDPGDRSGATYKWNKA